MQDDILNEMADHRPVNHKSDHVDCPPQGQTILTSLLKGSRNKNVDNENTGSMKGNNNNASAILELTQTFLGTDSKTQFTDLEHLKAEADVAAEEAKTAAAECASKSKKNKKKKKNKQKCTQCKRLVGRDKFDEGSSIENKI